MTEKQVIDKIIEILESTPTDDDLYFRLAKRINDEVVADIREGYAQVIYKMKLNANAKDN